MMVKAYLSQAYKLDQKINSKLETLNTLNELAKKDTATMSGMPGSPNRDKQKMADIVCRIVDLQEEINSDIDKLVDLKIEMYHAFKQVEDTDYRLILEGRYLNGKSWAELAVDLDIGMRWLYLQHEKALAEVEKFLPVH